MLTHIVLAHTYCVCTHGIHWEVALRAGQQVRWYNGLREFRIKAMRHCQVAEVSTRARSYAVCRVRCRFWPESNSRHLMLQCQDIIATRMKCVWCMAGKGMSVCGMEDPATWRLKVCRCQSHCASHALGFWCASTSSSVTSARSSAMTALTSVCIPERLRFLPSRSCVLQGLGEKPSKGLKQEICWVCRKKQLVSDLLHRGGVSASGHAAPAAAADLSWGQGMEPPWRAHGWSQDDWGPDLRQCRVRELGFECKHPLQDLGEGCLSNFRILCFSFFFF